MPNQPGSSALPSLQAVNAQTTSCSGGRLPAKFQLYLEYLKLGKRLAPTTLRTYETDLATLVKTWTATTDSKAPISAFDPDTFTEQDLRLLVGKLRHKALNPRSMARMLSVLRGYFSWRVLNGNLVHNPALHIHAPKAEKRLPKALPVDNMMALLDHAPVNSALGLRDAAIAELMYSSGLRISELIGLDVQASHHARGWVDAAEGEVTVTGKGNKQRKIPTGEPALVALRAWLEVRSTIARPEQTALFVGARGERISGSSIRTAFKQLAHHAGASVHIHPHMLRHSFASHVLQSSQDLRAVQEMLGHASIAATQVYTALDFQHLAKIYDAAHPRAKSPPKA